MILISSCNIVEEGSMASWIGVLDGHSDDGADEGMCGDCKGVRGLLGEGDDSRTLGEGDDSRTLGEGDDSRTLAGGDDS